MSRSAVCGSCSKPRGSFIGTSCCRYWKLTTVSGGRRAQTRVGRSKGRAFRADERIMKTLLLAAMTPEVECFRNLTAGRLAVLNHDQSPIAGTEGGTVLGKLQRWVSRGAGEIRIAQGSADPTVSVQLVGVDTQSILDGAKVEDNYGNRLRKLRELIFGQLGIEDDNQLFVEHEFPWRGTKRTWRCCLRFDPRHARLLDGGARRELESADRCTDATG